MKKSFASYIALSAIILAPIASVFFLPALAHAATSAELTVNGGFEQAGATATTAASWLPFNDGYTLVSGNAHSGTKSIELQNSNTTTLAGAYQRIDLNQTSVEPVFIGGYVKGTNVTMATGSYYGASMYAEIHFTDGTVAYWNSVPNYGTFDWRWVGFNTGSGFTTLTGTTPVTKPIAYIFVVPILGDASGTAYFDDISVQQFAPTKPALTLMYDDGNDTDYTIAKPTMDQYGFKGSSAIITGQIGASGSLSLTQMKGLASDGWEIVSHTVDHPDMTTLTAAAADAELKDSKATLVADGFNVTDFAFPYGAYNDNLIADATQYYTSTRTFETGYNSIGVFPYDIKIQTIVASTTVADVQGWIQQAKTNNDWLVIVTHLINATGDDEYHIDPTTYKSIISAVASTGINVITYQQGIAQYAVTPGTGTVVTNPTPLTGSCKANVATATTGTEITWTATAGGATAPYTYSWSGSNGLTGSSTSVTKTYTTAGTTTAQVVIGSGASTVTANCSVVITNPVTVTPPPLSGSCSANTTSTTTGTPVVWTATATGAKQPYTYSWSGTDSLTGSATTTSKTYTTAGTMTAQVIIKSGTSSITKTCSTIVTTPVTTLPTCPAGTDVSSKLSSNGSDVLTNTSSTCVDVVGIASYSIYSNNTSDLASQTLFASSTYKLQPKQSTTLTVALPSCTFQLDAFTGTPLASFANGAMYGSRLLGSVISGSSICKK
jgi:peptidoglycan/xylan/chitin deacetylase (PgdA/CDA1 family)